MDSMRIGNETPIIERLFRDKLAQLPAGAEVLELGTRRWEADNPTHHADWLPEHVAHLKVDYLDGEDVDIVADAHHLTDEHLGPFDAAIAISVWEHLEHPWIATQQLHHTLRPNAPVLISTHMAFPQHGYPNDYTRWTAEGLAALLTWAGFTDVTADHAYPCTITPPTSVTRWNKAAPAWLNVLATAHA
jgi:hypothetical protein